MPALSVTTQRVGGGAGSRSLHLCRLGRLGVRRLVCAAGGSLDASLWELRPGESQFVYHFHHGTEEMLIVLGGPFPRGPEGANPNVAVYPETGTIAAVVEESSTGSIAFDAVENTGPE